MDLRRPWCDEGDVATPWAVEIFERKYARNDYPLSALWEMGVTDLRIPISDILDPRVSKRVKELGGQGHRFTIVMFGFPNEQRREALAEHEAVIRAIEVVGLFSQWPGMIRPLAELRGNSPFEIYLNAVRPEVEGWTTHHGLHVELVNEIEWVLNQPDLTGSVDGFVFGVRPDVPPLNGYAEVQRCLSGTDYKFLLHVPCVGMDRTSAPTDEASRQHELARVAEAQLLARASPDTPVVIDNFVELDRGYFNCRGLVDKLYNPNDGSRIVTALNSLLPGRIGNLTGYESDGGRVLQAECDDARFALVTAHNASPSTRQCDRLPDAMADGKCIMIELINGEETDTSLRKVITDRAGADASQSPVLLLLDT